MDGLRAADNCDSALTIPFSGVKAFNSFGGSIPQCIWNFRNLSSLHITGNSLTGSIGNVPAETPLFELSLSHNLLSGTIPLYARFIPVMDVSYNKLTGEFDTRVEYTNESIVKCDLNRLSGKLHVDDLNKAKIVEVLHGNMINCDTIPDDDHVHNHDYACGSSLFNDSLVLWFLVIFCCCFILGVLKLAASSHCKAKFFALSPRLHIRVLKQSLYLTFFDTFSNKNYLKSPQFQIIVRYAFYLKQTGRLFLRLSGLLILISLPLCFMKMFGGTDFSKYTYDYMWVWCLTHLHGIAPAVLIIIAWTVVVSAYLFWFPKNYDVSEDRRLKYEISRESFIRAVSLFILNAIVVISANAIYVYSIHMSLSSSTQFLIKISMAGFKYVVNVLLTPVLCLPVKEPSRNITLRLRIFVFNNILVPCFVTFFSSQSCFQVRFTKMIAHI